MERTQFTFYESFLKAISRIKKKADRCDAYDAICKYALYGVEPELDSLPDSVAIAFELSKPNLDASRRKAASGKKGGQGRQTGSKTEANGKQAASKKEIETENKTEHETENECDTPKPPKGRFTPPTVEQVAEYCRQRGNRVDPQQFVDHYTANGWKVGGRGAMKDWQAAIRTWERNGVGAKDSPNSMAGVEFQPTAERVRKNSDWLDEFLAEQEDTQ